MSHRIAFIVFAVAHQAAAFAAPTARRSAASVQDDDVCWDPDIEFPTTCDEDD